MNTPDPNDGRRLAVTAEALYLANLLIAPGFAFAALAVLWARHRRTAPLLARNHLRQTFAVSLGGGLLIAAAVMALALAQFGYGVNPAATWVIVILYFTCVHSTLVLLGIFALARALAGQPFRYPLIGPRLEAAS